MKKLVHKLIYQTVISNTHVNLWFVSSDYLIKIKHTQGYFTSLCLFSTCFFKLLNLVAANSHLEQGYLTPSCLLSICLFNKAISQLGQEYLTPLCLLSTCVFR